MTSETRKISQKIEFWWREGQMFVMVFANSDSDSPLTCLLGATSGIVTTTVSPRTPLQPPLHRICPSRC